MMISKIRADHSRSRYEERKRLRRNIKEHPCYTYQKFDFWVNLGDFTDDHTVHKFPAGSPLGGVEDL